MTCLTCLDREDRDFASGCGCDHGGADQCGAIEPGLSVLPPQDLGFPQLRERLLSSVAADPRLAGWSARAADDLGVMLLESWAYVLDVVHFYNRRVQSRGFVQTAPDTLSLGRLVSLIGYQPRPATAGSVTVAALTTGKGPADVPAGLQVRSQGVPGIPPQIYEVSAAKRIDPAHDSWTTAPIRETLYDGVIAFAPGAPGVSVGQVVALTVNDAPTSAGKVLEFTGKTLADGADYRTATLLPEPAGLTGHSLAQIGVWGMAQMARPTLYGAPGSFSPPAGTSRTEWVLDGVYPQIGANDLVVVEAVGGSLIAMRLVSASSADIEIGTAGRPISGRATKVVLPVAANLSQLHFRAVAGGGLINPAETSIAVSDLVGQTLDLAGPVAAAGAAPVPSQLMAGDKGDPGALLSGAIARPLPGEGQAGLTAITEASATSLQLPATLYGNLLELTQGQTVSNEVLGSADASKPFQRFVLKRKPLTYLPDKARPGFYRPELEVRVNGILWTRVDSFLSAPAGAQVYLVKHTPQGDAEIVFGDKVRPPSGVGNVIASYRYGAGALAPPPGKLNQIVGKVPNLARVIAPLAVRGGSDAESSDSIRSNAPRSTRTAGRVVSLADYQAIVAAWPGVLGSSVDWAWADDLQCAAISAWIINAGGDVSAELQTSLRLAGDPLIAVNVMPATPVSVTLAIDLAIDPAFLAADVCAAVSASLLDPLNGLLAPARATIGGALFRSQISAAVIAIAGVSQVRSLSTASGEMPAALAAPAGQYLAFTLTVGGN